jgi:hypothetical protein
MVLRRNNKGIGSSRPGFLTGEYNQSHAQEDGSGFQKFTHIWVVWFYKVNAKSIYLSMLVF